jgi:5-methylcytosine-specific restriction endonuclease McrA
MRQKDPRRRQQRHQKPKKRIILIFAPGNEEALRAEGVAIYVEELRLQIRAAIDDGTCPYLGVFGEKLTAKNFSLDHATPISRGGSHQLDNLIVCSRSGNLAKGIMTREEFNELLDAMLNMSPEASSDSDRTPEGRRRRHPAAFPRKKAVAYSVSAVEGYSI